MDNSDWYQSRRTHKSTNQVDKQLERKTVLREDTRTQSVQWSIYDAWQQMREMQADLNSSSTPLLQRTDGVNEPRHKQQQLVQVWEKKGTSCRHANDGIELHT